MNAKSAFKLTGLVMLAALLAPLTLILGGAPMLAIRKSFGRVSYWLPLLAVALSFAVTGGTAAALSILVATVLIGVYVEVEEHGSTTFNAAAIGVIASVGAAAVSVGGYLWQGKIGFLSLATSWADKVIAKLQPMIPEMTMTANDIVQGMPASALITLFFTLWLALLLEASVRRLFRLAERALDERLAAFRVPDIGVWFLIASLAGAYVKHGNTTLQTVSMNVVNVMFVVYFFQGMAVVGHFFRSMKLTAGWRAFGYVAALYLNFVVCLIGFSDFWFDFRERLARKPVQRDRGFLN